MQCPICKVDLMMTDRQGIEIDYCPKCRGVWLDRGELDKIIEKSSPSNSIKEKNSNSSQISNSNYRDDYHNHKGYEKSHDEDHYYKKRHKKEGFLGDLFDF